MPRRSALTTHAGASPTDAAAVRARLAVPHPRNNTPTSIASRASAGLHLNPAHPLGQLMAKIRSHFALQGFQTFDRLSPVVTLRQNFDSLLTPLDHVSRAPTDTFYVDDEHLLRCHMTAHQADLLAAGHSAFLMAGDVYRRDEIDATHFPIFHQVDGVRVWSAAALPAAAGATAAERETFVLADLKATLESLVRALFGDVQTRWVDAYFPFTEPSAELEIFFGGKWLEVLGCGVVRPRILAEAGRGSDGSVAWAFGMGLERLAMVLHGIPDIRLFWTDEPRFLEQFAAAGAAPPGSPPVQFRPYSKYPGCTKDVTFWLPPGGLHVNDLCACIREVAGDLVERVELIDAFTHPKSGRQSQCYRITYRHMGRTLLNEEVDRLQADVRARISGELGAELR